MKSIILFLLSIFGIVFPNSHQSESISRFSLNTNLPIVVNSPQPTQSPIASPTPKPLTFEEMNKLYGPCIRLPILMYHHVQTKESAESKKQTSLSVYTNVFKEQMEYLKQKGYKTVEPSDLISFFENGIKPQAKSIYLTFDDAYADFYTDAYPILKGLDFKATVFVPTGLVGNPDYLNWDQITNMKDGGIYFANHTWSHRAVVTDTITIQKEIETAETQLNERSLDSLKIFAYPYGSSNTSSENYLETTGYRYALSTKSGSVLCSKKRFDLPRIIIGNRSMNSYGI